MTKIVIDTNIAFSALLNVNSRIGQIIITGCKHYRFYSPEYVRFELHEHTEKLKHLGKLTDKEFLEIHELVFKNIEILSHSLIPFEIFRQAENICNEIDIDDTPFIALTEYIRGKLWTGDLKLINSLSMKGYKRFITTEKLYQDFVIHFSKKNK